MNASRSRPATTIAHKIHPAVVTSAPRPLAAGNIWTSDCDTHSKPPCTAFSQAGSTKPTAHLGNAICDKLSAAPGTCAVAMEARIQLISCEASATTPVQRAINTAKTIQIIFFILVVWSYNRIAQNNKSDTRPNKRIHGASLFNIRIFSEIRLIHGPSDPDEHLRTDHLDLPVKMCRHQELFHCPPGRYFSPLVIRATSSLYACPFRSFRYVAYRAR